MIFKITKDNIDSILNEGLKKDAAPYVTQYENFNNFIKSKGIKISEQEYSEQENILINKFFPGGLTLIFEKSEICPYSITSNKETIGIRIPNHKGFWNLVENVEGYVLATTSLNRSNYPPVKDYIEADKMFGDTIKIINPDKENPPKGVASTVVLCTGKEPEVLRQGEIFI